MNVLANKRLDLDIINIISDLSTELQIKAFLVGGYVRDLILDRKSKDIDILIVGDGISFANEVKKKLHGKVDLQIFKNFGTAMIIYDGFEIEFVGSRKESYQKNSRNPSITVGTFEAAKRKPDLFRLRTDGYHSVSRSRQYMWVNGQKVQLDARDPGGEHE